MNIAAIEESVRALASNFKPEAFIFDLLLAYGKPKASIARLKSVGRGSYNLSSTPGEILWKKQLLFKTIQGEGLHAEIDTLRRTDAAKRNSPRFVIVTNNNDFVAVDTKTQDSLSTTIAELHRSFDFFLPWSGLEKAQVAQENPADVKAAEKMAKLFDQIRSNNPCDTDESKHALNVFLSRLLFCYFAEDTGIFSDNLFTDSVASHTAEDGSDLKPYLERLFAVLNTDIREGLANYLAAFPYVNGGLFAQGLPVPVFDRRSRALLIECGSELDWSEINPDIFGSMFQAVVDPSQRGNMGMHYTSVPNIMKLIEPLFLAELNEEFEKNWDSKTKLELLLLRLEHMRFFDPACGSGNFLIIAYKSMRELEMEIFKRLQELSPEGIFPLPRISLSQFYGIELDDFAHEIAVLSMWLAQHQMNVKFIETFGQCDPSLPLRQSGNIRCGNATQIDWEEVCPKNTGFETYVLGNPPYKGSKVQDKSQKEDMKVVFEGHKKFKDLDYISCWFYKASAYLNGNNATYAFVTTNSICQGSQVSMLWPLIYKMEQEISFAYAPFKWVNNARNNAGVTVTIIGVRKKSNASKFIYSEGLRNQVRNINAYLTNSSDIIIGRRSRSISGFPKMDLGNMPIDGGNLILDSTAEKDAFVAKYPESERLYKKLLGTNEYIKGQMRWCIWIEDADLEFAMSFPDIRERICNVREMREGSTDDSTKKLASRPHQFREMRSAKNHLLIVSRVSSERREYLPMGLLDKHHIIADAQVVYDPEYYLFGLLATRLHMIWAKATSGCLESRVRYSSHISYNNFPVPKLSAAQIAAITEKTLNVMAIRECHPEKTIGQLYDPDKMPMDLRLAHRELDAVVEQCYRSRPFSNDEERLEHLFKLYEQMTEGGHA